MQQLREMQITYSSKAIPSWYHVSTSFRSRTAILPSSTWCISAQVRDFFEIRLAEKHTKRSMKFLREGGSGGFSGQRHPNSRVPRHQELSRFIETLSLHSKSERPLAISQHKWGCLMRTQGFSLAESEFQVFVGRMFQVSKHEVTHGLGSMFQDVDRHSNREYDFIRARTEPLPRQYPLPLHKVQGRSLKNFRRCCIS